MILDEAKDALRNGAPFSAVYPALVVNYYNMGLASIDNATTELRRFFCYDLPLQERWVRMVSPPSSGMASTVTVESKPAAFSGVQFTVTPVPFPLTRPTLKLSTQTAKQQGYEGDPCTTCGGMKVRRNGACLLCEECQTSSGCS
jgi:hypothetical protein